MISIATVISKKQGFGFFACNKSKEDILWWARQFKTVGIKYDDIEIGHQFLIEYQKTKTYQIMAPRPAIQIGKFSIVDMSEIHGRDKVWISLPDGEGGEFSGKELEPFVEEFYKKNF